MASDSIVGQRRGLSVLSGNLSVRNQPQLNKCLESVTYAECQPVSFIQQLLYCFLKLCVLECRSKEFCGAVRLIACTETAWEHDNLRLGDRLFKHLTESTISAALKFLNTLVTTFAPARSKLTALSYSQFVPGNTGINTVGCAILCSQI